MTVPAQAVLVPPEQTELTAGQFVGRLELFNEDGTPWTPDTGTTTVSWGQITDKPSTFPPTIGSTATTAVAGNDPRLTDQRTPVDRSVSAPKLATELAHLGDIPAPPATGTYVLTSTDGVLSWVAQA